jgi:hypothetical protein
MKYPNLNVFMAWFFIPQTLAMAWVAEAGRVLLAALGVSTSEGAAPGRMVGALLLLLVIYLTSYFLRALPPRGKPGGAGYKVGHRLVLAGNILAALLFVFQFFAAGIESYNAHLILDKFTTAFGYIAMGCFAVGFSLIYQSALPQEEKKN